MKGAHTYIQYCIVLYCTIDICVVYSLFLHLLVWTAQLLHSDNTATVKHKPYCTFAHRHARADVCHASPPYCTVQSCAVVPPHSTHLVASTLTVPLARLGDDAVAPPSSLLHHHPRSSSPAEHLQRICPNTGFWGL